MEGARAFAVSMKSRRNLSDSRRRFRGILTQAGYEMAPPKNGKFLANPVFSQFLSDFGFEHTIVKHETNKEAYWSRNFQILCFQSEFWFPVFFLDFQKSSGSKNPRLSRKWNHKSRGLQKWKNSRLSRTDFSCQWRIRTVLLCSISWWKAIFDFYSGLKKSDKKVRFHFRPHVFGSI